MLAQGQAEKAIELFSESLLRTPNKSWSVLGLARSYAAQGLSDQAREQYQKLTQILVDDQLPGYQEALSYLAAGGD
jgi:tetratricopeptide (TPR) repeat protein